MKTGTRYWNAAAARSPPPLFHLPRGSRRRGRVVGSRGRARMYGRDLLPAAITA